jgi:large subunit ribosomal protein L6
MERNIFFFIPFLNIRFFSMVYKINKNYIFILKNNINFFNCKFFNVINIDKKYFYLFCGNALNKKNLLNIFLNIFFNFVKGLNQGFYIKFKIIGLGFKVKKIILENKRRYLKINLGFSHSIFYKIPNNINIFIKKKIIFLQGSNLNNLTIVSKNLQNFRYINPYKEKGILLYNKKYKLKSGKQQQK